MSELDELIADPATGSAHSQRVGWNYALWRRTLHVHPVNERLDEREDVR